MHAAAAPLVSLPTDAAGQAGAGGQSRLAGRHLSDTYSTGAGQKGRFMGMKEGGRPHAESGCLC